MKYAFIYIVFFTGIFFSCQNYKNKNIESLEAIVNRTLGKKLNVPSNLMKFSPFIGHKIDSSEIANAELKIYTHINTSCESCISKIKLWKDFALELNKYHKIPIIIICSSQDDFEDFKFLIQFKEIEDFAYPFFLDIENEYLKSNEFMYNVEQFETILTNKENKILLMGNPLVSENIKDLYINEIEKTNN